MELGRDADMRGLREQLHETTKRLNKETERADAAQRSLADAEEQKREAEASKKMLECALKPVPPVLPVLLTWPCASACHRRDCSCNGKL